MSVKCLGNGEWGIVSDTGRIVAVLSDDTLIAEWGDFEKASSKEKFFYWVLTRECLRKSPSAFRGVCIASFSC